MIKNTFVSILLIFGLILIFISCNKKDSNDNNDFVGLWHSSKADTLVQHDDDTLFQDLADTIWIHHISSNENNFKSGVNKNYTLDIKSNSSFLITDQNDTTQGTWIQDKVDSLDLKINRGRYFFDFKIKLIDNNNLILSYWYESITERPLYGTKAEVEEITYYNIKLYFQK